MTYTTIQGDTWDAISFKLYGTALMMPKLIAANPQHASTVIFSAGVLLAAPETPAATSADLPPWKR
ncbi:tail protein X [Paenibacillus harenae]|uniref:Phage tail protein X n=1 Tax=Paenibacillus harenae TaxID=306543 RepID=A0ABT9U812_PAEHA|nr:tail protein X [Paenibacillus harenae]MDQ0114354.1 phage tail protein X [Paenibacillus harenae]